MNYRMMIRIVGRILLVEAVCLFLSFLVSLFYMEGDSVAFLLSAVITAIFGLVMINIKTYTQKFFSREGLLSVGLAWLMMSLFGALPFIFSHTAPSIVDAFFESVSGFTTTGSSIFKDVQHLPHGILFWRAFTHFLGGMGVLVLMSALLPSEQSMKLIQAESPGPTVDKFVPKVGDSAKILYLIYMSLTALEFLCLKIAGMPLFDSVFHAFGTAGTGGFGMTNEGIASYHSPAIEYIIAIFMVLFATNFALYFLLLTKRWKVAVRMTEVRVFYIIVLIATGMIAWNILPLCKTGASEAVRLAFFQVATLASSTGYSTANFDLWPTLSKSILLTIMLIGACAGSTGGGMKVTRVVMIFRDIKRNIQKAIHPRAVQSVRVDSKAVKDDLMSSVMAFACTYIIILMIGALLVSFDGYGTVVTKFTAVLSAISNMGPGLEKVGPAGCYVGFSAFSKLVLSACMLLGRLEIFPFLMLFVPSAWKRKY